jgi:hypothetical protein
MEKWSNGIMDPWKVINTPTLQHSNTPTIFSSSLRVFVAFFIRGIVHWYNQQVT